MDPISALFSSAAIRYLSSGVFSLRTTIPLLECTPATPDATPVQSAYLPLLHCVQIDLPKNPNLTCSGSARVQTPQMAQKTLYDLSFPYILVCGSPNFSLLRCIGHASFKMQMARL